MAPVDGELFRFMGLVVSSMISELYLAYSCYAHEGW